VPGPPSGLRPGPRRLGHSDPLGPNCHSRSGWRPASRCGVRSRCRSRPRRC